jgi:hypothetical protein
MRRQVILGIITLTVMSLSTPLYAQRGKGGDKLESAKKRLKERCEKRLKAATKAMEKAVKSGMEVEYAEMAMAQGLDNGLNAEDFDPLGQQVKELLDEGLKGKELANAIHEEIKIRKLAKGKSAGKVKGKGRGKEKKRADGDKGKQKNKDGKGKGHGKDKADGGEKKEKGKGKGDK